MFETDGCIVFLCQPSALGFPFFFFFTTHHTIFFVSGNVFHDRDKKSFTLPWIRLRVTVISFRGGYRTLPTYDVALCICYLK